ncbi:MAG: amidotransferase 1, exosortase A system-associated [Gammaproteobacteria bacterium]|nr:amidotransferase 1, exosortase A system-associated [Gammaproteobacteria bacterium]
MCGIAGIFDLSAKRDIVPTVLDAMNQVQFHRGPDEGGRWIDSGVGLAHRRLSIIDLSTGQQPLFNHDRSVCIVFNGEIYNFKELTQQLKAKGYRFQTHSDTETIVHAWEEWGERCVDHLRGMFAFAIYDKKADQLFLARDRLGIKPLFYALTDDGYLLFGSELKVLLEHPSFKKNMDITGIEDYCALGYIPEPKTIYKNVHKLPSGYRLLLKRGQKQLSPIQYWEIPFTENSSITESQASEELVERLKEAVDIRMIAEVPLGAFLSGGVDSSGVVAMMSQLQDDPVNTCSISFDDKQFNESEYAEMVSQQYHTNHHVETVETDDFELLDKLALLYDEPYADSSAIPTYRVCQLARKHVTVALSGDGGDEPLSGYRRHIWHMNEEKVRSILPYNIRKPVFGLLGELYPKADWAPKMFRAKTTFQALARSSVEAYFNTVAIIPDDQRDKLFSPEMKQKLAGYQAVETFKRYANNAPGMASEDPLALIEYLDMKTYLVDDILTKVDRASMAHSLEVRVPMLDHKYIEWISSLPAHLKIKGQTGKHILKKSLEPYLPNDVLYRKKMGFSVPLANWFRGPLKDRVQDSLLGEQFLDNGLFNADYLKQLVEQHQSGVRDNSASIWTLMMLESFQRQILN